MRYLNKITFINSAAIKYAEAQLDGNIHFIGTQGVGKSTLLRAILFFYNADTQKLGISREKKNFLEYYLPYANSFILYEVHKETGSYTIMAFQSRGKICFRFIDTAYHRQFFMSEEGQVFDSWDKSRALLDQEGIHYSRKIDRYEEYRDILYGNFENREVKSKFRKYAFMESRQYQNIPRTIQNVFLNSKLEAEFIKETIIMSLNEEAVKIGLQEYTHHLRDFETNLSDIRQFRQVHVQRQSEQVSTLHTAIKQLEHEKEALARQLAWKLQYLKEREPALQEELAKTSSRKEEVEEKISRAENLFSQRKEKLTAEINVLEDRLKTARRKEAEYEKMNIGRIIERFQRKEVAEKEKSHLLQEKELLTAEFNDITQKYSALLDKLDNQLQEIENSREKQKLEVEKQFQRFRETIDLQTARQVEELAKEHEEHISLARQNRNTYRERENELKRKKAELKYRRFFEKEIAEETGFISELKVRLQQSKHKIAHLKEQIVSLQERGALEQKSREESYSRKEEVLKEQIGDYRKKADALAKKLQNSQGSLYAWLSSEYPGWEHSIGKVLDEELLFRHDLSPQLIPEEKESLYGVSLNLSEIDREVKTLAAYQQEKAAYEREIEEKSIEIGRLSEALGAELDRMKKKYQPKIKELKEEIGQLEYHLEQDRQKLTRASVQLEELNRKAAEEKEKVLNVATVTIAKAAEETSQVEEALMSLEEEKIRQLKAKEREKKRKIVEEQEEAVASKERIEQESSRKATALQERKTELSLQQQSELSRKGADTGRLTHIAGELRLLEEELLFIEKHYDLVVVYKKDKSELFDNTGDFKSHKQLLEQKLGQQERKFEQQKGELLKQLGEVQSALNLLQEELKQIREDEEAYQNFCFTDCYTAVQPYLTKVDKKFSTAKTGRRLIEEVKEAHYKGGQRVNELKEAVNKFLSYFSDANIFNFKTKLIEKKAYLQFAEELKEFLEEDKIVEFEKRVNQSFSDIIRQAAKETIHLFSKAGEIQGVISKINKDFEKRNFAGVIRKIELKLDDSANKVVQVLSMIKEFHEKNPYDSGALNLFSSHDQEAKNKEAVELLKQFVKEIAAYKKEWVTLSESFELKFRVQENQNDTGWVERLSSVGSEGTDVLVKAMINIMLLNVFKERASEKGFKDFRLHCMMDEIGKLHPNNVRGILKFANDRNILLINGSPTENDALAYKHIYKLEKDNQSITKVKRIISQQHILA